LNLVHFIVYCFHFTAGNQCLQYDIQFNSIKSGLLHLTGQPYCKKSRSAKVKDGIINLFLGNYLVGRYSKWALTELFFCSCDAAETN